MNVVTVARRHTVLTTAAVIAAVCGGYGLATDHTPKPAPVTTVDQMWQADGQPDYPVSAYQDNLDGIREECVEWDTSKVVADIDRAYATLHARGKAVSYNDVILGVLAPQGHMSGDHRPCPVQFADYVARASR